MSSFLDDMASLSAARVAQALRHESADALQRRARRAVPSAPLRLSATGFDVIAELKLRSPAAGRLSDGSEDWLGRVAAYARGGAAAVSVLTEPSRFDGSLEHLRQAAAVLAPLGVPAMRKDFLVDPYQVLEARAAGAGGVLVILRMLPRGRIEELLDVAAEHGMFVLLEAFDEADLAMARDLSSRRADSRQLLLIGSQLPRLADPGSRDGTLRGAGAAAAGRVAGGRRERCLLGRRCAAHAAAGLSRSVDRHRPDGARGAVASASHNLRCDPDSATLNGYTRRHVDKNLRHHQCGCGRLRPPRPM